MGTATPAYVKWLEEPVKWDVVPVKHVRGKTPLAAGSKVEVKWAGEFHPAVIVEMGKQNVLAKKQLDHERKHQNGEASPPPEPHKRSRQHDDGQTVLSEPLRKQQRKRQERLQSLAVLEEIDRSVEECPGCLERDSTIDCLRATVDSLQKRLSRLQELMASSGKIDGVVRRLEDAVIWLEENRVSLTSMQANSSETTPGDPVVPPSQDAAPVAGPSARPDLQPGREGPEMVMIGPSTAVPATTMRNIQWHNAKKAVRELLVVVFTTPVLRASSMTGRPSNGNKYRQTEAVRPALDQVKLKDVIDFSGEENRPEPQ